MTSADSPKRISRFELLEQLGEGGIGTVYKAMDPLLQKVVAIKVLNAGQLSPDQQVRFQNEARTLAELKHPAIPEIFNFSISEGGAPYLVMEFAEGKSLSSILEQETFLSVDTALDITRQACDALQNAHSAHILHRDIKPANIIISDTGTVKIVDFGLAKFENDVNANQFQTKTGLLIGSPLYMSPERFRSAKIDARSDIYSLGCVLYEMLTGEPPYAGESSLDTANMHLDSALPLLPERVECTQIIRENLQSILNRCLAKKPEERFKSMQDLEIALDNVTQSDSELVPGDESALQKKRSILSWTVVCVVLVALIFAGRALMLTILPEAKEEALPKSTVSMSSPDVISLLSGDDPWFMANHAAKANPNVSDEDFRKLAKSDRRDDVEKIQIDASSIDGTGIKYLKGMKIKSIKIYSPNLSEQAFDFLPPTLTDLQIGCAEKIPLSGYKKLAKTNIESVKLGNMQIPDGALLELAKMPRLGAFYIRNEIPGRRIHIDPKPIALMHHVIFLEINGCDFTNKDLPIVTSMKQLEALNLENLDIDDSKLETLSSLPHLRDVRLRKTKITIAALEKLEKIKSVGLISIQNCPNISKAQALAFKLKHQKGTARFIDVQIDGDAAKNLSSEELTRHYMEKHDVHDVHQ